MKQLKRFVYLGYYLKNLESKKLAKFIKYASAKTGKSKLSLLGDAIKCVFVYNTSVLDYFLFGFYEKDKKQRSEWAGTGFMYEYQKTMNPVESRMLLEDKIRFNEYYKPYVKRLTASFQQLKTNPLLIQGVLINPSGKMVMKDSLGQVGAQVEIVKCNGFTPDSLVQYMKEKKYDLLEEFVVQHDALMDLSPSGLNTIRVFTQLNGTKVDILGVRLRITVNSAVDNMAAGNLAAPVEYETGKVSGAAVYSDITLGEERVHPVTGKSILGFQIPMWDEVKSMVTEAALLNTENKSIGWDVAISKQGPELIEGNHNWCKILWQLPAKKGLKAELEKYM